MANEDPNEEEHEEYPNQLNYIFNIYCDTFNVQGDMNVTQTGKPDTPPPYLP